MLRLLLNTLIDTFYIKGLVETCINSWDTASDILSASCDLPYRSLWKKKKFFATLLNPTQTVFCIGHKGSFLKYLFGDLNHDFKVDMDRIFYNATTMKGAFTFADISLVRKMI